MAAPARRRRPVEAPLARVWEMSFYNRQVIIAGLTDQAAADGLYARLVVRGYRRLWTCKYKLAGQPEMMKVAFTRPMGAE